ncbi:site-specific integrase [Nocardia farcinica]|uniref:tyrosine-type recombinase/integrase n=1 Tax=Nocardia farcinica TaxID=37329 RepID=UPI0018948E1E|nr:tyrosine-type recombinase/integrase [Nocardia farcinica]MBF6422992.1 site-specific integrase [Nocardia farcinica]MBF6434701.1 site-specific integrase [Nocardia farcinica]MBF6505808.1 site-specific integrase [Nocardia farcinica]
MKSSTTTATAEVGSTSRKQELTREARGVLAETILDQFPARPVLSASRQALTVEKTIERLEGLRLPPVSDDMRFRRRLCVKRLLGRLEIFPGETWQQRWQASGAETAEPHWTAAAAEWHRAHGRVGDKSQLLTALMLLSIARIICPSPTFLLTINRTGTWTTRIAEYRDPSGFGLLKTAMTPEIRSSTCLPVIRWQLCVLLLTKGGGVRDITVGDCVELRKQEIAIGLPGKGRYLFYTLLEAAGFLPQGAPVTLRAIMNYGGRSSIERLVDRYHVADPEVRNLLVSYLAERQVALDYTTLDSLSRVLVMNFWTDLEAHHPGIDSLDLDPKVAHAWKERLRVKIQNKRLPDGTTVEVTVPRVNYLQLLTTVRAFYLDIAQWATEDSARWPRWAVPCPIRASETAHSTRKVNSRRKARMDQRTRERLPLLPVLVRTAERRTEEARLRLDAALNSEPGKPFTVFGETFTRVSARRNENQRLSMVTGVFDSTGRRRHLRAEDHRAFWGWAAVEFLRHTGVRVEEMLETSHHSIIQYRHPQAGQIIPLLHVAPSKTDEERLLVVSPELADVISAIIARVRQKDGAIPLVPFYDLSERCWATPAPLLFQWNNGSHTRAIAASTIRKCIREILESTDIKDAGGQPLYFVPHDLRRIFATDAILNGMPPHIAHAAGSQRHIHHHGLQGRLPTRSNQRPPRVHHAAPRNAAERGIPHPYRCRVGGIPGPFRAPRDCLNNGGSGLA